MGIDYIVTYDCPIKQELSPDGLIDAVKQRYTLLDLIRTLEASGIPRAEVMARRHQVTQVLAEGQRLTRNLSIAEQLVASEELMARAVECTDCPAGMGEAFGCHGYIEYPISASAESWLAGRARKSFKSGPPKSLMVQRSRRNHRLGPAAKRLRISQPGVTFARPIAIRVDLTRGFMGIGGKIIDSDTIFDALTLFPILTQEQLFSICHFSGGLLINPSLFKAKADLTGVAIKEGSDILDFELIDDPEEDSSIHAWKGFFRACFTALRLHRNLRLQR